MTIPLSFFDPSGLQAIGGCTSFPCGYHDPAKIECVSEEESGAEIAGAMIELQNAGKIVGLLKFYRHISNGTYDFKWHKGSFDRMYQVKGRGHCSVMRADEFGNYFAGYVGAAMWGALGTTAVNLWGHIYALIEDHALDDPGSRMRILQGALDGYAYDPANIVCAPTPAPVCE